MTFPRSKFFALLISHGIVGLVAAYGSWSLFASDPKERPSESKVSVEEKDRPAPPWVRILEERFIQLDKKDDLLPERAASSRGSGSDSSVALATSLLAGSLVEDRALGVAILAKQSSKEALETIQALAADTKFDANIRSAAIFSIGNRWEQRPDDLAMLALTGEAETRKAALLMGSQLSESTKTSMATRSLAQLPSETDPSVVIASMELLRSSSLSHNFPIYLASANLQAQFQSNENWRGYICSVPENEGRPAGARCP